MDPADLLHFDEGSEQRIRILRAAMQRIAESGSRALSVAELAREANVARGTVYNNFDAGEDLFDLVALGVAEYVHRRFRRMQSLFADPRERLAAMLAEVLRLAQTDRSFGLFMVKFGPTTPPLQAIWGPELPHEIRTAAQQHALHNYEDRAAVVQLIAGAVYSFIVLVVEGQRTWKDAAARIIELLLPMLGAERADATAIADRVVRGIERPDAGIG